jgi:mRNA interferase RelE/StbE
MKAVRYTVDAAWDLKRHGNVAARVRKTISAYADEGGAHANNVIRMVGSTGSRMRIGNFRVLFEETETAITVTKIAPRGGAYD